MTGIVDRECPLDPEAVLNGLKDFQRCTVEHVHRRFYLDHDATDRFLVADEVGLGKTMVARGVIAKSIAHLWDDVPRIDIVYICSNADIARQNANRLNPLREVEFTQATRLTLLPETIHGLRENKLNFVALTPGTSFDAHSSEGMARERALLYLMLREAWDLCSRQGPLNVFCYSMRQDRFRDLVDWVARAVKIDPELKARFLATPELTELQFLFDQTQKYFVRRRDRSLRPGEAKTLQRDLIGNLRMLLARSCVDALEPDLVILDEFQRFKHLIGQGEETTEAARLAQQLFDYRATDSDEQARTLLLSATPYSAYGPDPEDPGRSHQEAFGETVSFLLNDQTKVEEVGRLFEAQRRRLLSPQESEGAEDRQTVDAIRQALTKVMCRTERLAATANRDGMVLQVDHPDQRLHTDDVMAYLAVQKLARQLGHPDMMEYWKSSPYLLNLMDHYKFKRDLEGSLENGLPTDLRILLEDGAPGMLDRRELAEYGRIDPGNSRLRLLIDEVIGGGIWRLLWLNPSLPYYEPSGPFAGEAAKKFTKRLVFSAWRVVPRAISILTSYAVQQKLADAANVAENSPDARKNRSGRLIYIKEGSPQPAFALAWPSLVLARLGDPLELASGGGDGPPTKAEVVALVERRVSHAITDLKLARESAGREDPAWYWAMPLLLDAAEDPKGTREFVLQEIELAKARVAEAEAAGRPTEAGWIVCLERGLDLLDGDLKLGSPPGDLAAVMAKVALAGFGVSAYRSLARRLDANVQQAELVAREKAVELGNGLRALFNLPEGHDLIRGIGSGETYWTGCLEYAMDGNLQAVLDEYAHVMRDHLGLVTDDHSAKAVREIADEMIDAVGMRASSPVVDFFDPRADGGEARVRERLRTNFAIPYGDQPGESEQIAVRSDQVRKSFNSPFWPFILSSTSVGQEGLDFHLYCHALVHWNLPSNPVDMEQREGRIHRYKNHAIRRNLAGSFGERVLHEPGPDPWQRLFAHGEEARPEGQSDLWPYWIFLPDDEERAALIERHVMALPLSRDKSRLESLLGSLVLYRSVLGQPRQQDLVAAMQAQINPEEAEAFADRIRIDLSPPG